MKLRKFYTVQANELIYKDQSEYKKFVEYYAVLVRGSGNPFGKGGNYDKDLKEYYDRYRDPIDKRVVNSLILKYDNYSKNPFNDSGDNLAEERSLYKQSLNDSLKNLFKMYEEKNFK